ncbi:MAG: UvrD-helicase domain-containing protein [Pseudomonadota bacterium]
MRFYADLHIHSKYSRATSQDCDLEHLAGWAQRKGLDVVATGDFTHPAWFRELQEKLVPAEPGLWRLEPGLEKSVERELPRSCQRPPRFLLSVEIATIYKKENRTRKIHHLVYAPDFETAGRLRRKLEAVGNLSSDGRPILGLDSRHLLEMVLESGDGAFLVPAHIWTPWFAVLGSKSGWDSIAACYGDLADHVFAAETGLSSDPPMNWRVESLDRYRLISSSDAHSPPMLGREASVLTCEVDYFSMRHALENGSGYEGTLEFFPEEGKYHLDGHRACRIRLEPAETRRLGGRCPSCGHPVTIGVMHRVEELTSRPEGPRPPTAGAFRSLVPLAEIVGEIRRVGAGSKSVIAQVAAIRDQLGPELAILLDLPIETIAGSASELLVEAIRRLRRGQVIRQAGYDGEYGQIRLFEPGELDDMMAGRFLFAMPAKTPPSAAEPAPNTVTATSPAAAEPTGDQPTTILHGPLPSRSAPKTESAPPEHLEAGSATTSLLAMLDPEQRTAVLAENGPLLIIAGPGTGKTRTLTSRLAHLITAGGFPPESCLALTFTRRAAEEMRARLDKLIPHAAASVPVTTFHGLGFRLVREHAARLGLPPSPRIIGDSERLEIIQTLLGGGRAASTERHARVLSQLKRSTLQTTTGPAHFEATGADQADSRCGTPPLVEESGSRGNHSREDTHELLQRYQRHLTDHGTIDLDDLLVLPVRLLAASPDLAADHRRHHRFLAIDEYQDIDDLQYRLVRLLAPADDNLCAIGDPDQAIYSFRGADVGYFLRFQNDYPAARIIQLARNYRSSKTIVGAALQAIAPTTLCRDRSLLSCRESPSAPRILVHQAATDRAEAEFVVHTMEKMLGGWSFFSLDSGRSCGDAASGDYSFADFAVLYRMDAQAALLGEAMQRAGIPFQKRSHNRLLELEGVRKLVAAIREAGSQSSLPGFDERPVGDLLTCAATRLDAAAGDHATAELRPTGQSELLVEAVELLEPIAAKHGADLTGFLAELALGAEIDTWDPRADRVSLLTLHAAKGLEFPVVLITGLEDGILPLRLRKGKSPASTLANVEEERRLLFVGMTRAQSHLVLCHARRRARAGRIEESSPSPFLADIERALLEQSQTARRQREPTAASKQLRLW